MTVYVDDMRARVGRLVLSHMVADSDAELRAMARAIQLPERYHQGDHFDVCQAKRAAAIARGAVPVRGRTLGCMRALRRARGATAYPSPAEALAWQRARIDAANGRAGCMPAADSAPTDPGAARPGGGNETGPFANVSCQRQRGGLPTRAKSAGKSRGWRK